MTAEPEPRPYITRVWARNFRSIEYAELELGPLTVLVGPNASGKSNLLDILGFLADAARDGLKTAITRRGGIDSIGRRTPTGRVLGPEIGLQYQFTDGTLEHSFALTRRGRGEYRIKREYARLELTYETFEPCEIELVNRRLIKPNLKSIFKNAEPQLTEEGRNASSLAQTLNQHIPGLGAQNLLLIAEEPSLTALLLYIFQFQKDPGEGNRRFQLMYQALLGARYNLRNIGMYHIFPNSLRDPQKVADSHPLAAGGENLASILKDTVQKKNRFLPELKEALSVAVPGVRDIRVKTAGSYYVVELKHERDEGTGKGLWFDLSHESDGTLRLLAILTALFQDPAPPLIGLEEPELAIHPGAMAVLADTMKEASLRGQVLVATHSPDLINLLPIESIRAVTAEDGSTRVGRIAEHQLKSVKDNLFLPGELHSMEGLQSVGAGE